MNNGAKNEKWDEARWADIDREMRAFAQRPSDEETIALYMKHGMSEDLARRGLYAYTAGQHDLTPEEADRAAAKGGLTEYLKALRQYWKDKKEAPETAVMRWDYDRNMPLEANSPKMKP